MLSRFPNRYAILIFALATTAANAGPPYLTDDPEPPPLHRWEAVFFTMGAVAQGTATGALPALEFNYGGFENTQLHIELPLGFQADGGDKFGPADIELGVKYRFIDEDERGWRPQVATYPQVEIPTASSRNGFSSPGVNLFLPLWLQKDVGENWTINTGGGYWITPGSRNYWFSGVLLQRKLGDALVVGAELFHQTANTQGGRDNTGFNVGATYDLDEHDQLLVSAGRGIQNAASTNQFSWYLGYKITD
ncbi:MAG TPA: transporter [Rhizomicrobium sp.]|jgi:hypothetical protein